jgi:exosortase/archaeosortase family protein
MAEALILVVAIYTAAAAIGYIIANRIATRRIKQPFLAFLARFAIVFFVLFFLEFIVFYGLAPSVYAKLQGLTATSVGGVLSLAGAGHSISGSTIMLQNPSLSFDITVGCLGGELFWTYVALVLAETNATKRQRILGIIVGLAILLAFNFFRITLSVYLEWRTGFHVHDMFYLFNTVFVLLVWVVWLRTLKPGNKVRKVDGVGETSYQC